MSIYKKLHEAKKSIGKVSKNSKNPHFKNTYADLNALIEAVEPILLEHDLVLMQPIKEGKVFTEIYDIESGDMISSEIDLPTSGNPQQMGSAITYFRRYTLQSLLSLQAIDDDGNGASIPPEQPKAQPQPQPQPKKELFTSARFNAAYKSNATVQSIKEKYELTPEVEKEWLAYVIEQGANKQTSK